MEPAPPPHPIPSMQPAFTIAWTSATMPRPGSTNIGYDQIAARLVYGIHLLHTEPDSTELSPIVAEVLSLAAACDNAIKRDKSQIARDGLLVNKTVAYVRSLLQVQVVEALRSDPISSSKAMNKVSKANLEAREIGSSANTVYEAAEIGVRFFGEASKWLLPLKRDWKRRDADVVRAYAQTSASVHMWLADLSDIMNKSSALGAEVMVLRALSVELGSKIEGGSIVPNMSQIPNSQMVPMVTSISDSSSGSVTRHGRDRDKSDCVVM